MMGLLSGRAGMLGNLSASMPLNFVFPLCVVREMLPIPSKSTVTSVSCTSEIYEVKNFDESVNRPSDSTSTHSVMTYSIAISRLFPVRVTRSPPASMRIFSRIGVRFDVLAAWLVASMALRKISVCIRNRMNSGERSKTVFCSSV